MTITGASEKIPGEFWDKGGHVFNVKHPDFGAVGDGVTDDTTAIQAAITAAMVAGGRVVLPAATYLVTDTLTIAAHGVVIEGASSRYSRIKFNPASNKVCLDFIRTSSALTLNRCGVKHLTVESSNTTQKTAVQWTDVSEFVLEDAHVDISFVGNGTNYAVGWSSKGREYVYARHCLVYADVPLQISQNPRHASIDSDYMSFDQCAFVPTLQVAVAGSGTVTAVAGALTFSTSQAAALTAGAKVTVSSTGYGVLTFNGTTGATCTGNPTFGASAFTITPASPNYAVTMDSNLRSVQHIRFRKNLWAQGKGGLSWVSTGATLDSVSIVLEEVRIEQTQNCLGYFANIDRNANLIYHVRIVSCSGSTAQNGIKLRRCSHTTIENLTWASTDATLMVLDLDSTVVKTSWRNLWTQAGAGSSLTGQTKVWALNRINSVDNTLPIAAYYDTSTNGAMEIGNAMRWMTSSRIVLPSDALPFYESTNTTILATWQASGRLDLTNGVRVGTGTAMTNMQTYTPSITPASVAAASVAEQTFTVTGVTTADKVFVNPPTTANNIGVVGSRVSAADTVAIRFINPTAGALTPTSGTYTIWAVRS